jgi:hypothetical protein
MFSNLGSYCKMEDLQIDLYAFVAENAALKKRLFMMEQERTLRDQEYKQEIAEMKATLKSMKQKNAVRGEEKNKEIADMKVTLEKITLSNMNLIMEQKNAVRDQEKSQEIKKELHDIKSRFVRHERKKESQNPKVNQLGNYFVVPRTHFMVGNKRKLPCNHIMRLVHCLSKNVEFGYNTTASFSEYYTQKDVVAYSQTVLFQAFWDGKLAPTAESLFELVESGYVKHVKRALALIQGRKVIRKSTRKFLRTLLESFTDGCNQKRKKHKRSYTDVVETEETETEGEENQKEGLEEEENQEEGLEEEENQEEGLEEEENQEEGLKEEEEEKENQEEGLEEEEEEEKEKGLEEVGLEEEENNEEGLEAEEEEEEKEKGLEEGLEEEAENMEKD